MAHLYLAEDLAETREGDIVTVTGAEARHAVTVGRLRAGEVTSVGNGRGLVATGTVASADPAAFSLTVESVRRVEHPRPAVWLAQALAKHDRDELAIQAATELGVDGVVPWAAARSIVRWEGAKAAKQRARWASILREAGKQSLRAWLPELAPLESSTALARRVAQHQAIVLDPDAGEPLSALEPDGRDLLLIVGPEGGVSPSELELFVEAGASARRLGDTVLRTSTAGPAAIAVLATMLGRW